MKIAPLPELCYETPVASHIAAWVAVVHMTSEPCQELIRNLQQVRLALRQHSRPSVKSCQQQTPRLALGTGYWRRRDAYATP